ncbi:MAG: hypothetical protein EXR20_09535 [Bacteroidetes bacterium]|nr:hypothetical protein [Bacteroidota bacterium]
MYSFYLLFSEKFGMHYTGFTGNLRGRILSHTVLGKKDWSTRYRSPRALTTFVKCTKQVL